MRLNELKTKAQDKINALKEQFESQDNSCDGLDLTVRLIRWNSVHATRLPL